MISRVYQCCQNYCEMYASSFRNQELEMYTIERRCGVDCPAARHSQNFILRFKQSSSCQIANMTGKVDYSLYLVTDSTEAILGSRDLIEVVEQALQGGRLHFPFSRDTLQSRDHRLTFVRCHHRPVQGQDERYRSTHFNGEKAAREVSAAQHPTSHQ